MQQNQLYEYQKPREQMVEIFQSLLCNNEINQRDGESNSKFIRIFQQSIHQPQYIVGQEQLTKIFAEILEDSFEQDRAPLAVQEIYLIEHFLNFQFTRLEQYQQYACAPKLFQEMFTQAKKIINRELIYLNSPSTREQPDQILSCCLERQKSSRKKCRQVYLIGYHIAQQISLRYKMHSFSTLCKLYFLRVLKEKYQDSWLDAFGSILQQLGKDQSLTEESDKQIQLLAQVYHSMIDLSRAIRQVLKEKGQKQDSTQRKNLDPKIKLHTQIKDIFMKIWNQIDSELKSKGRTLKQQEQEDFSIQVLKKLEGQIRFLLKATCSYSLTLINNLVELFSNEMLDKFKQTLSTQFSTYLEGYQQNQYKLEVFLSKIGFLYSFQGDYYTSFTKVFVDQIKKELEGIITTIEDDLQNVKNFEIDSTNQDEGILIKQLDQTYQKYKDLLNLCDMPDQVEVEKLLWKYQKVALYEDGSFKAKLLDSKAALMKLQKYKKLSKTQPKDYTQRLKLKVQNHYGRSKKNAQKKKILQVIDSNPHQDFQLQLNCEFARFINTERQQQPIPQVMVKDFDRLIRDLKKNIPKATHQSQTGQKTGQIPFETTQQKPEIPLTRFANLFVHIDDLEQFYVVYRIHLACRLLHSNKDDLNLEQDILDTLKQRSGEQQIESLFHMIDDIRQSNVGLAQSGQNSDSYISESLMKFREIKSELVGRVLMLRKSVWAPINPITIPLVENIELEKQKILQSVQNSVELQWADNLSHVEMVDKYQNISFQLSLPQAVILLQFNYCDAVSKQEIMKGMKGQMNEKAIEENLYKLVQAEILDYRRDQYQYKQNLNHFTKSSSIEVELHLFDEELKYEGLRTPTVSDYMIQGFIVRTVKKRETMKIFYQDLIKETLKNFKLPDRDNYKKTIKDQIEKLLGNNYIKRAEENNDILVYVP